MPADVLFAPVLRLIEAPDYINCLRWNVDGHRRQLHLSIAYRRDRFGRGDMFLAYWS